MGARSPETAHGSRVPRRRSQSSAGPRIGARGPSAPGSVANTRGTAGRCASGARARCRNVAMPTRNERMGDREVPEPYVELPERDTPPRGAILVLHGGKAKSREQVDPGQLTVRRMQPFVRDLAALGDDL